MTSPLATIRSSRSPATAGATRHAARPRPWLSVVAVIGMLATQAVTADDRPPVLLSETGLYVSGSTDTTAAVLSFSPQYPLWSDGSAKRRWILLPPGTAIDASRADAWEFPPGTRLWKEFSLSQRIETRMIERMVDGSWRYLTYVWRADGLDADLAPADGFPALAVSDAPDGRYVIPSQSDCLACHEGTAVPVLGFSALQLSPDRDPDALHATAAGAHDVDLRGLVEAGLLENLPQTLLDRPPRITAASPDQRAALGYLHGNCGHCHNDPAESGAGVPVDLLLAHSVSAPDSGEAVLRSLRGAAGRFRAAGTAATTQADLVFDRMRSRDPRTQMPPLGTRVTDDAALALLGRALAPALPAPAAHPAVAGLPGENAASEPHARVGLRGVGD